MKKISLLWVLLCAFGLSLLPLSAQEAQPSNEVLYVSLVWHQHQPVYFKDPETSLYERPWVRLHATKDYVDMVTILEDYPDIHATFNLTPSLIRQLEDLSAGAKDKYWVMSEITAEELSEADKRFILQRFFDINPGIISCFPRYGELQDMRKGAGEEQINAALASWTPQDFRDLQVLFNLAWIDPDFLAQEPLRALVEKERDFDEADKAIIFAEHQRLIDAVIPTHRAYQEAGQIEVTMTPFAHPILPLLVDSNSAAVGMPEAELPERFIYGQDAVAQVEKGVAFYERLFGVVPRGMWPAEGSVSPQIIQMVANVGINWIATDEYILARSLDEIDDFTRDSDGVVQQADALYRPYRVAGGRGGEVSIIFRDHIISDLIGFEYSGTPGQEAADDLIGRLNAIQARLVEEGATGHHLVTILLDGENAWEYYPNDGKEFLHAMYQGLSDAPNLQTVTPSEYLVMSEEPRELDNLFPGSWVTPDFATWIGEEEENLGWSYLKRMRDDVADVQDSLDEDTLAEVMDLVYIAEGSDWFWWYGSDQNSGNDEAFDSQFRSYLRQIYTLIGEDVPNFVNVPIIAQASQEPDRAATDLVEVSVDGIIEDGEWDNSAVYEADGFYYGYDAENLYLRLDNYTGDDLGIYLRVPDAGSANANPRGSEDVFIGFGARRLLEISGGGARLWLADGEGGWMDSGESIDTFAVNEGTLELQAPLAVLSPAARSGSALNLRLFTGSELIPAEGPALAVVPDMGVPNVFLSASDPANDDYGPGSYVYPKDGVFRAGVFDLVEFVAGQDEEDLIFQVSLRGPLVNDWGAPNGMGVLTLDIYIDSDGAQNGLRQLLPGRNAALNAEYAWDHAIFAEGWESAIYQAGADGASVLSTSALNIISNPGQHRVTIRVPKSTLPGDPTSWSYLVTAASQEGYPSAGVLRIRDVQEESEQWRIGGSLGGRNATRLMDVILPAESDQAALLSAYTPSDASLDDLSPDDFAQLPMVTP